MQCFIYIYIYQDIDYQMTLWFKRRNTISQKLYIVSVLAQDLWFKLWGFVTLINEINAFVVAFLGSSLNIRWDFEGHFGVILRIIKKKVQTLLNYVSKICIFLKFAKPCPTATPFKFNTSDVHLLNPFHRHYQTLKLHVYTYVYLCL